MSARRAASLDNGRCIGLEHPAELAPTSGQTAGYAYYPWGPLQSVTGLMGDSYGYAYDFHGRLTSLTYPGSVVESFDYDDDGRLTWRLLTTNSSTLYDDTYTYDARGKVDSVMMHASQQMARTWYTGLGGVAATEWGNNTTAVPLVEEFRIDGLGTVHYRHRKNPARADDHTEAFYHYLPGGQLSEIQSEAIELWAISQHPDAACDEPTDSTCVTIDRDTLYQDHDRSGNVETGGQRRYQAHNAVSESIGTEAYKYFYGADQKLRVVQRYVYRGSGSTETQHGVYEEYRYDALGRRVLLRSRQDSLCTTECLSHVTRFVWDGNQLLHELRAAGGDSDNPESESSSGRDFGEIAYTHGPGIDAPLGLIRSRYSNDNGFYDPFLIVPHANWRGQYDSGTLEDGNLIECPGGDWRFCLDIDWPGQRLGVYFDEMPEPDTPGDWMGSLLNNKADQSGLLYKRNRYYDPQTGRFTQQDPIGLAGGLNVYGFAAGDPVSFSDPFGLRPDTVWVGVRALDDPVLRFFGNHAAVRVNDQVGELLNADGVKEIDVRKAEGDDLARYNWIQIDVPEGMSPEEFDQSVIRSFNERARAHGGQPYSPAGSRNSNRFIWEVIIGAEGTMPAAVRSLGSGMYTPGICGGSSLDPLRSGLFCQ